MKNFIKTMANVEKIEWLIVMALAGIGGMVFGILIEPHYSAYVDQVQPDVVVVHRKKDLPAALEMIETPTFRAGELATVFTADKGTMMTEKKYSFSNARLVTLHQGTSQISSIMTADTAEMEFTDSSMNEIKAATWHGNFKRQQFRKGKR